MSKPGTNMERRSIDEWLVQTLRLTLFPSMGEKIEPEKQNWWHDLLDIDASNINIQRENRQRQEDGPYEDDKWLVLSIQPDRIDWRLTSPNKMPEPGQVPNIGPYLKAVDKFSELMLRWLKLDNCPSAARLALGAILITPVETAEEGYRQISAYVHLNLNTKNASNFLYQISRARPSESVHDIEINRLSKWSVSASRWIKSSLIQGELSTLDLATPQALNCRLELDINNMPKPGLELDQNDLANLYKEFEELSKEIIREGDTV